MKTTLDIDDAVLVKLEQEAARQGRTSSEVVEAALRDLLRVQQESASGQEPGDLAPLPVFDLGEHLVDIADRRALYKILGGERRGRGHQCVRHFNPLSK